MAAQARLRVCIHCRVTINTNFRLTGNPGLGPISSSLAPKNFSSTGKSFPLVSISVMLNPVAPSCNYFEAVAKFGAKFCFFCSDPCDPKSSSICIRCGAKICIASRLGGAGCIGAGTLEVAISEFECPVCIGSRKTETAVIPYYLTGSGLRRTPKIAWPLLLLNIQLKNLDSLVLKMVSLTMESNYVLDQKYVRFALSKLLVHSNVLIY